MSNAQKKLTDEATIEQGEELNDKTYTDGTILSKDASLLYTSCLESTLLQGKKKDSCTVNTVQIIFCRKRRHWITASTKFSESGKVDIYDTMFNKLDAEI